MGLTNLCFAPIETSIERLVQWRYIRYAAIGRNNVGQEKKVSMVEYKDTPPNELITYLKPQLGDFIVHNYVSQWQEKEFKYYLQHILQDTIMSCIDLFIIMPLRFKIRYKICIGLVFK